MLRVTEAMAKRGYYCSAIHDSFIVTAKNYELILGDRREALESIQETPFNEVERLFVAAQLAYRAKTTPTSLEARNAAVQARRRRVSKYAAVSKALPTAEDRTVWG